VVVTAGGDRRAVRFSVSDFGIGMSGDEVARCFEQFWQARAPESPRTGGVGIGLYIVRSLVEAMGGHISVRSAVGRGSTFTVSLPRSARAAARVHSVQGTALDVGEPSSVQEFMRQIGVPMRGRR
jgi:signal transduction histidine kinase